MKAVLLVLFPAVPLTILNCSVSITKHGCFYEGELIIKVTDSLGDVHLIYEVETEVESGDGAEICGVPRRAPPTQVGDKYFFTASNGVEIEAEALGQSSWHLVGVHWEDRRVVE